MGTREGARPASAEQRLIEIGIKLPVVVITGASSGIGEATAVLLAERGASLVLGARREDRIAELAARLGDRAVPIRTDVTERDDLHALVALADKEFGRLDVLVSNAGAGPISPLDDLRVDEWDEMVDVNIKGLLHGIAAALPVFRRQGAGHFVTVGSTAAFRVAPAMAVYAGTKSAAWAITEGMRREAGDSLRVTTISPGFVATPFAEASNNEQVRSEISTMRDQIAIPPAAIARAIAFAIEQPDDVDVNEIVVRPTAQA
jgi:NADP-dependent 3-hydroxy acid dehydrogenase YdfG